MPIYYQPEMGECLRCDFDGIVPEMVKRRSVVVITPQSCQREGLTTVVPISTSPPPIVMPWHVKLSSDPDPDGTAAVVWAKCDMVAAVSHKRLTGYYRRWNGQRKYIRSRLCGNDIIAVRTGVLAAFGLDDPALYALCIGIELPITK